MYVPHDCMMIKINWQTESSCDLQQYINLNVGVSEEGTSTLKFCLSAYNTEKYSNDPIHDWWNLTFFTAN
jgi:hypothetical protein